MPTSTDLVTDLPADFEVFGQAVATSMADLLGGTTGQVLSKASNTNMDFTWVTSDDANAIQNAIVDAKGDLIAASAADTPARLAVGANNTLLVADSAEATGLKWAGGWTTWTPTLTFTLGNGSTVARYQQVGKTINGYFKLTWGSTSAFNGQLAFTLPVAPLHAPIAWVGIANDFGTGSYSWLGALFSGTTVFGYGATTSTSFLSYGDLDANDPFTWTTNDSLFIQFSYEVA